MINFNPVLNDASCSSSDDTIWQGPMAMHDPSTKENESAQGPSQNFCMTSVNEENGRTTGTEFFGNQISAESLANREVSWIDNPQPFRFSGRARQWLNRNRESDARLEKQRLRRAFHAIVDRLLWEEDFASQRPNRYGHSYYLFAQFSFKDGKREWGVVCYRTLDTAAGVRDCYHRQFIKINRKELFQGPLDSVLGFADQEVESLKNRRRIRLVTPASGEESQQCNSGYHTGTSLGSGLPRIEKDPLHGSFKIHDEKNELEISIYRLPLSETEFMCL